MDDYDRWNQAIISYFLEGAQRGASIFLSVDDNVIPQIGYQLRIEKTASLPAFCRAVHDRIFEGDRIELERIVGLNASKEPNGVAFLAALVLAASRMEEQDFISHSNYFTRLREVIELPVEEGRPRGMKAGAEEPLWIEWARWLQEQGFLPSAYAGEGPMRFTSYPISQTLLRRTDKNRLSKLFTAKHWPSDWDIDTLLTHIRHEASGLSQHLQALLNSDAQRYQAIAEVIYDFYEDWQCVPQADYTPTGVTRVPHLSLVPYRTEDLLRGQVDYFFYPRVRRWHYVEQVQVRFLGSLCTLVRDRPGWYTLLGPIDGDDLDKGAQYPVEYPPDLGTFVFPQRLFWLLVPDPDNPDANTYAPWESPSLGTSFIILCRRELVPQLERFRKEGLIDWRGEPDPLTINPQWVEISQCMILIQDWSEVQIENQQLYEALRPKQSLNISPSGGLRVPGIGGWLEDCGPSITVFGFEPEVNVKIRRVSDNNVVLETRQPTNEPFLVEWPGSGDYRIEASLTGADTAPRLVKIVAWEQLHLSLPNRIETIKQCGLRICGALIEQ